MMGTEYDIYEAPDDATADHRIAPKNINDENEDEQYDCYEVADDPTALAVPNIAPEAAFNAVERGGWEAVPQSELERAEVVEFTAYFHERPAYYREDPPEYRYEEIPTSNAQKFLDYRGREYERVTDAVWYPERGAAALQYMVVDDSGRRNRHGWEVENVTTTEHQILLEGADVAGEDGDEGLTREEIADIIDENSTIYPREAEIASCWVEGVTDYQQIVRELGADEVSYDSVASSTYNFRDRQKAVAWTILHVWQHVPDDHLPDEAQRILKHVDVEEVRDPAFHAPGKGRGKK